MSYNGSGVYTLPGAALANGNIVSATENNQFRNDVAAALNIAWTRDGQAPATANIPMGSHKLTGLAAGTGAGDSVRYEQLPGASNLLPVASGGTGSGTASGARTNLGVVIGTDVQAYAAELQGATQGGINGMKNRIINGAMMIDQRNAGASVGTASGSNLYTVDRMKLWYSQTSKLTAQQNAGSVTPPAGFKNYLGFTSSSAYSVAATDYFMFGQPIEGLNVADLAWGTANASAVTVSFKVYSSLTGTFGGSIGNADNNRFYPFAYTISAANTWANISVTIPGDTTGTWLTTNGIGLIVYWGMGIGSTYSGPAGAWSSSAYFSVTGATSVVGTNGATFYITGVQLEKGSTATSFDYRPYGTELALCQTYYNQYNDLPWTNLATATYNGITISFPVTMRATPTVTTYSPTTGTAGKIRYDDGATDVNSRTIARSDSLYVGVNNVSTGDGSNMRVKLTISSEL